MFEASKIVFQEIVSLSSDDVAPIDYDVSVSVRARLFVPETKGMHQLMHHHSSVDASRAEGHGLRSTDATNVARTPDGDSQGRDSNSQ